MVPILGMGETEARDQNVVVMGMGPGAVSWVHFMASLLTSGVTMNRSLTSLCLSCLVYKVGIIVVPTTQIVKRTELMYLNGKLGQMVSPM